MPLADMEDGFRVSFRFVNPVENLFVTRSLALLLHAPANPPHNRVKPEQTLDEHVKRGSEIVSAGDVRRLVQQDRFNLGVA